MKRSFLFKLLNNVFLNEFHRYTNEARVTYVKADKRDPEWAFYDVTKTTMAAYAVKPAAFDFLLTLAILSYLGVIYVFLQVRNLLRLYFLFYSDTICVIGMLLICPYCFLMSIYIFSVLPEDLCHDGQNHLSSQI